MEEHARSGGLVTLAEEEPHVERLPADLLAHVLSLLPTFHDLAMAGGVSRRWRRAVGRSLAARRRLSFAGQRTGDESTARLVRAAVNLRDLDISRSCWGCHITDRGLVDISSAACVANLTSVSLWGLAGISDKGVVHLVSKARSLQHLNIGGTFITDESLYAVANSCANLKAVINAMGDFARRLVVAEAEVEKLRRELASCKDVISVTRAERDSAISQMTDVSRKLEMCESANKEFAEKYKQLEAEGKAHDEELAALLDPIATGLSEALWVPVVPPGQVRTDALMDLVWRLQELGEKSKDALKGAAAVLPDVFENLLPDEPIPLVLPEMVAKLSAGEDLFDKYYLAKTKAGAKAALTFALASGIDGDFEKAYKDVPRRPDGKKVPLKPFADRAGKLAEQLAQLVAKIASIKASSSASPSVAP